VSDKTVVRMNNDDDKKTKEEHLGNDDTNSEDDLTADENTSTEEAFKDTVDAPTDMNADVTIKPVDGRSADQISTRPLGAIPKVGSVGSLSNVRRVSFGEAILNDGNKNLKKKDSDLSKNPKGDPILMPVNNDALTAKEEAGTTGWVENTDQTSPRQARTSSESVEKNVLLDINTVDTVSVPAAIPETEDKHYAVRPQIRSHGAGKLQQEVRKRSSEKKPIKSAYGVFNTAYQAKAELEALCLGEGGVYKDKKYRISKYKGIEKSPRP